MNIGDDSSMTANSNEAAGSPSPSTIDVAIDDPPAAGPKATVSAITLTAYTLPATNAPKPAILHTASVGVPESLQTMNAKLRVETLKQEISLLEDQVRCLSEELDQAHRAGRSSTLYMRHLGGVPRIVVQFADNSSEVKIDDSLLGALGNTVRAANRIYLHGHTDAFVASEAGTQIAIRRAVEVRTVLLALNVESQRIRLFYRGAGNFVANNSTREGKALNRRVEIELRKW